MLTMNKGKVRSAVEELRAHDKARRDIEGAAEDAPTEGEIHRAFVLVIRWMKEETERLQEPIPNVVLFPSRKEGE